MIFQSLCSYSKGDKIFKAKYCKCHDSYTVNVHDFVAIWPEIEKQKISFPSNLICELHIISATGPISHHQKCVHIKINPILQHVSEHKIDQFQNEMQCSLLWHDQCCPKYEQHIWNNELSWCQLSYLWWLCRLSSWQPAVPCRLSSWQPAVPWVTTKLALWQLTFFYCIAHHWDRAMAVSFVSSKSNQSMPFTFLTAVMYWQYPICKQYVVILECVLIQLNWVKHPI